MLFQNLKLNGENLTSRGSKCFNPKRCNVDSITQTAPQIKDILVFGLSEEYQILREFRLSICNMQNDPFIHCLLTKVTQKRNEFIHEIITYDKMKKKQDSIDLYIYIFTKCKLHMK